MTDDPVEDQAPADAQPMMKRACEACAWYKTVDDESGECRANPPTIHPGSTKGHWPVVGTKDWCRQYVDVQRGWQQWTG